jgi:hypothetical protein
MADKGTAWLEMLSSGQRETIKKMSTDRLISQLEKVGHSGEDLLKMKREMLLELWAEAVLTGEEKASAAVERSGAVTKASDEISLEKERLEW